MTALRVLHSVACLDPETGGTAEVVPALVRALEQSGTSTVLVTRRPRAGERPPPLPPSVEFARRGRFAGARDFRRLMARQVLDGGVRLLHDHGIWLPSNHASARVARRLGVPRIVTAHGMLDPWAMRWHGARKRLAWRLYQRRDLAETAMLHATSFAEAAAMRSLGFEQPIIVIQNGVEAPSVPLSRQTRTPRVALFVSRIHPKKGLLNLVDAWAAVRPVDWELWIAGPDELGHEAEVRARAARAGIAANVRFLGPAYGAARTDAFGRAELFVLPTLSENFGLVIAEALASGLPVLTTTRAPWASLVREGCGWWVAPPPTGLAEGLRAATSAAPETLRAMGLAGHAFARRRFAWEEIGRRMRAAYDALPSGAACPDVYIGTDFPTEDA